MDNSSSPCSHPSHPLPVLPRTDPSSGRGPSTWHLRLVAVSCRHHPLVINEGAPAEVVANVQGHLVGDRVPLAGVAPDDLVVIISGESDLSGDRKEKLVEQEVRCCGQILLIKLLKSTGWLAAGLRSQVAQPTPICSMEVVFLNLSLCLQGTWLGPYRALAQTGGIRRPRTKEGPHSALIMMWLRMRFLFPLNTFLSLIPPLCTRHGCLSP